MFVTCICTLVLILFFPLDYKPLEGRKFSVTTFIWMFAHGIRLILKDTVH